MLGAERLLVDDEGLFEKRTDGGNFAEAIENKCEVVERLGYVRVVGVQVFFSNGQGAFV